VEALSIYISLGAAYGFLALAAYGAPHNVRNLTPKLRLRVHAVALLLSMVLWPVAVARIVRQVTGPENNPRS